MVKSFIAQVLAIVFMKCIVLKKVYTKIMDKHCINLTGDPSISVKILRNLLKYKDLILQRQRTDQNNNTKDNQINFETIGDKLSIMSSNIRKHPYPLDGRP